MESAYKTDDFKENLIPQVILIDNIGKYFNMKNAKRLKISEDDDDNVRYKINTKYLNNKTNKVSQIENKRRRNSEDNVLYKFPDNITEKNKTKTKPKIKTKVKFFSGKKSLSRLHNMAKNVEKSNRRHTVAANCNTKTSNTKTAGFISQQVALMPPPEFSDHHIPMVTVPDDLIISLNAADINELNCDLNSVEINNVNPKGKKLMRSVYSSSKEIEQGYGCGNSSNTQSYDNELEYFSKYVVQKLRNMETNQRIFSENLVNTVLMLGQLGKLNIKTKITDS